MVSFKNVSRALFRTRGLIATLWILLLLVFADPWISLWSVLAFLPGLGMRFWGAGFIGPASRNRKITTVHLVTTGPYAIFRHPLYVGNGLLVAAGLVLLRPHWILLVLTGVGFLALYVLIGRAEERRMSEHYGETYVNYKKRVSILFPKKIAGPLFRGFNWGWAVREYQTWVVVGLLYLLAFLRYRFIPPVTF